MFGYYLVIIKFELEKLHKQLRSQLVCPHQVRYLFSIYTSFKSER